MTIKSTGRGPGLPSPWMFDLEKSNGIIAEVNSHDMDSLRWFTGSEAVHAYAEAANFQCDQARDEFPLASRLGLWASLSVPACVIPADCAFNESRLTAIIIRINKYMVRLIGHLLFVQLCVFSESRTYLDLLRLK